MFVRLLFSSFVFFFICLHAMETNFTLDESTAAASDNSVRYSSLPPEMDTNIMQHVPVKAKLLDTCGADVAGWMDSEYGRAITWSPDSMNIAIGYDSGLVEIRALNGGKKASYQRRGRICALSWAPKSRHIATARFLYPSKVVTINELTGKLKALWNPAEGDADLLWWFPDGQHIAVVQRLAEVMPIYTIDGEKEGEWTLTRGIRGGMLLEGCWSPCGQYMAYVMSDGMIYLYNSSGVCLGRGRLPFRMDVASFSPDGHYLAHGSYVTGIKPGSIDRVGFTYDNDTPSLYVEKVLELKAADNLSEISWSPNGRYLAILMGRVLAIKNVDGLLLVSRVPALLGLRQYVLLLTLAMSKEPVLIGKSDRDVLETMPEIKRLLRVERSKSKTKNPIWRLIMQGLTSSHKTEEKTTTSCCSVM